MSRSGLRDFQTALARTDLDHSAHLAFIASQLEWFHRWQACDVKKMCQVAIKQFFVDDPSFNDDENFLRILQVLTHYSRNMGGVGIYKQMDEMDFFQRSKKFHYLWAEALAERHMIDEFKLVVQKAVSKIGLTMADLDVFMDLSKKHLGDVVNFEEFCPDEGDRTVAFFVPNKKARRRSVAVLQQAAQPTCPLAPTLLNPPKTNVRLRMMCRDREEDGYVGLSFEEFRAAEWEDTQNVHDNNAADPAANDNDMDISMDESMAPVPVPAAVVHKQPVEQPQQPSRMALAPKEMVDTPRVGQATREPPSSGKRVEERVQEEAKRMRIHSPQQPLAQNTSKRTLAAASPMGTSFTTNFTSKAMSVFSDTVRIDSRQGEREADPMDDSLAVSPPAPPAEFEDSIIFVEEIKKVNGKSIKKEIFSETLPEEAPPAATPVENIAPVRPAPLPLERPAERRPLGIIPVPKPVSVEEPPKQDKSARSMFAGLLDDDHDDLPPVRRSDTQEICTDRTLESEFDVVTVVDESFTVHEKWDMDVNVLGGLHRQIAKEKAMQEQPPKPTGPIFIEDEETIAGTKFTMMDADTRHERIGGCVTSTPAHPHAEKPPVLEDADESECELNLTKIVTSTPNRRAPKRPTYFDFFAGSLPGEAEEEDEEEDLLFGKCDASKSAFMQRRLSVHGGSGGGRLSIAPKHAPILEQSESKDKSLMSAIGSMNLGGTFVASPKEQLQTAEAPKTPTTQAERKTPGTIELDDEDEEEEDELNCTGVGLNSVVTSSVNPWSSEMRVQIMRAVRSAMVGMHEFEAKAPVIKSCKAVQLGGEEYIVGQLIGKGGYAHVYKCTDECQKTMALKYEIPSCAWEAWICDQMRRRLADQFKLQSIMEVTDAYIFDNASLLVNEYIAYGTLLDLGNKYKDMSPILLLYIGVQVASILRDVHACEVIHADAKPDNFMLLGKLDESWDAAAALDRRVVRLIDWGRAIDMRALKGKTFCGRAGTDNFDCCEMMAGREWTYQTDFFAFLGTMYVLMNNQYMTVNGVEGRNKLDKPLRRRMDAREMWVDLFDELLNIPSCNALPSWDKVVANLEKAFKDNFKPLDWKMAVRRFNEALPRQ